MKELHDGAVDFTGHTLTGPFSSAQSDGNRLAPPVTRLRVFVTFLANILSLRLCDHE